MSIVSKRPPPERETPTPRVRDHEHVSRISTQTTLFALIAVALILYEIQWILPPFVFAALLAYITTPAIEWASARTRLPRVLFVLFAFSLLPMRLRRHMSVWAWCSGFRMRCFWRCSPASWK